MDMPIFNSAEMHKIFLLNSMFTTTDEVLAYLTNSVLL